jgi:hemerythrin-like domain-containing protein
MERSSGVSKRRNFVIELAGMALAVSACSKTGGSVSARTKPGEHEPAEEAEVTPGEDLMQEHGVLERVLLVYEEAARRIDAGESFDPRVVASGASIVRRFVEDYHERNEERYVFPRLQHAGRDAELVAILLRQHERGRELTDEIVARTRVVATPELARLLRRFSAMYRPHAAREDTVVFPAFRAIVGREGYHELGEQLEEREHQLFGEHGFEQTVADVARLEQALGIADLSQFTP